MGYVKNITAHYRLLLDEILERRPEFSRASSGHSQVSFSPNVDKNFHRGHTDYFANGRLEDIGAFDSPKYVGLHLGYVTRLAANFFEIEANEPMSNGDGLNYMVKREVAGIQANTVERVGASENGEIWRVFPNEKVAELTGLKVGTLINRNRDHRWEHALTKKSAERRIPVYMTLTELADGLLLKITDEDGVTSEVSTQLALEPAQNRDKAEAGLRDNLAKLGNTMFEAAQVNLDLQQPWFVPSSVINALRRDAVTAHEAARLSAWQRPERTPAIEPPVAYPETTLSYLANVYNHKARSFYEKHAVQLIAAAYESHEEPGEVSLMITKHCLRFSFNLCPKQAKGVQGVQGQVKAEPMTLVTGEEKYTLKFDCKPCEMHIIGAMKKHILQAPPPSSVQYSTVTFHKNRPQTV